MVRSTRAPSEQTDLIDIRDGAARLRAPRAASGPVLVARLAVLFEETPPAPDAFAERDLAYHVWVARYHGAVSAVDAPTDRQVAIFECMVEALDEGVMLLPALAERGERAAAWAAFGDALQQLALPARYVGSYRVAIETAARHATALVPSDREIAGLLLVHAAAEWATTPVELRFGLRCAQAVSQSIVTPRCAVNAILRTCLRAAPHNPECLAPGLLATLQLLAASPRPLLDESSTWALREAFGLVPESDPIRAAVAGLRPADRAQLEAALHPPVRTRSWPRRLLGVGDDL